jgi:acetoin:2,6-dichlorophenolindophenol oxidoreductase subunit alpha
MIRFYGHFEGDAQAYRAKGEVEDLRTRRDCIKNFAERVIEAGVVKRDELSAIDREILDLIENAVRSAKAAPLPTEKDLLTDVYVSY